MSFDHTTMQPFPQLSWARPATLKVGGVELATQVSDLSARGCKMMPRRLERLHDVGLRPGDAVVAVVDGHAREAVIAWATPNLSALGCRFN